MKHDEEIRQVGLPQAADIENVEYYDGDVAFHRNFRDLPIDEGSLRMDMYLIMVCTRGRVQADINGTTRTLAEHQLLISLPNDVIDNYMFSPDFDGVVMCLSRRIVAESIVTADLIERGFQLRNNPVKQLSADDMEILMHYGKIFEIKLRQTGRKLYRKEIMVSLVKSAIYGLISTLESASQTSAEAAGTHTQANYMFQRFMMLLSNCSVKPRSVGWYAGQLCVTPKYLSSLCRKVSGRTALEWIQEYVDADVTRWLKHSGKSIKEIAYLLGFPSISFFGKYCRKRFGLSPTLYRQQLTRPAQ